MARGWRVVLLSVAGAAMIAVTVPGQGTTEVWEVPEEERAVENPLEASADVLDEGAALYGARCALCHGGAGKGDGPMTAQIPITPPDLSTAEARARMTDGEISYKIRVGRPPMPAMEGKMTEDEIWAIVHHLRTLQVRP